MKDAKTFLVHKKNWGIFFGLGKKDWGIFLGMLKNVVIFFGRQIFLGIKYEPLSDPSPLEGPWVKALNSSQIPSPKFSICARVQDSQDNDSNFIRSQHIPLTQEGSTEVLASWSVA